MQQDRLEVSEIADFASLEGSEKDLLRRRAEELARPAAPNVANLHEEWGDVLLVRVGQDSLCLPTHYVQEVAVLDNPLPLPGLPDFYTGVASLRSRIYAVVDAARLFGLSRSFDASATTGVVQSVIVQGPDPDSPATEYALAVDAVEGVFSVKARNVSAVPEGVSDRLSPYAYALVEVTAGHGLVLDMPKLLADETLRADIALKGA